MSEQKHAPIYAIMGAIKSYMSAPKDYSYEYSPYPGAMPATRTIDIGNLKDMASGGPKSTPAVSDEMMKQQNGDYKSDNEFTDILAAQQENYDKLVAAVEASDASRTSSLNAVTKKWTDAYNRIIDYYEKQIPEYNPEDISDNSVKSLLTYFDNMVESKHKAVLNHRYARGALGHDEDPNVEANYLSALSMRNKMYGYANRLKNGSTQERKDAAQEIGEAFRSQAFQQLKATALGALGQAVQSTPSMFGAEVTSAFQQLKDNVSPGGVDPKIGALIAQADNDKIKMLSDMVNSGKLSDEKREEYLAIIDSLVKRTNPLLSGGASDGMSSRITATGDQYDNLYTQTISR